MDDWVKSLRLLIPNILFCNLEASANAIANAQAKKKV